MEKRRPIVTEFLGRVFDSKSEAMFACGLMKAGIRWGHHCVYGGREWDFWVRVPVDYESPVRVNEKLTARRAQKSCGSFPISESSVLNPLDEDMVRLSRSVHCRKEKVFLVEYKPCRPTDTYIRNLCDLASSIDLECCCIWGSYYDKVKPWNGGLTGARFWGVMLKLGQRSVLPSFVLLGCDKLERVAQHVLDYRFDIESDVLLAYDLCDVYC